MGVPWFAQHPFHPYSSKFLDVASKRKCYTRTFTMVDAQSKHSATEQWRAFRVFDLLL
jgi:hypothetical protein